MKKQFKFLKIEIKRAIKMLPQFLFITITLFSIVFGVTFICTKYFNNDNSLKINIAIVNEDNNSSTNLAIMYIEKMKSISKTCNFIKVDKEKGFDMLNEKKVAALIYLPPQTLNGILNGNNIPAQIYFPQNAKIESTILKEYAKAGIHMLQIAQSQIYAINDIAYKYGLYQNIYTYQNDINDYNLKFALDRLKLFDKENLSSTNDLNIIQYYIVNGIILFMLLFGISFYPLMKEDNIAFLQQAKKFGVGKVQIYINKTMVSYFIYVLVFYLIYFILKFCFKNNEYVPQFSFALNFSILLSLFCITTFLQMIYSLTNGHISSIVFIFFITMISMYISGGFIPSGYLPRKIQLLSIFLPTTYIKQSITSIYSSKINTYAIRNIIIFTIIFILITTFYKKEKNL